MANKEGKRTPEAHWFVLARCLVLLRRMQRGPAKKRVLMSHVQQVLGDEAYGDVSSSRANKRFENDKYRLRDRLGVDLAYSSEAGGYVIRDTERPLLDIADQHLETLAFLADTFQPGSPHATQVQALIETLIRWLGPERRRIYERLRGIAPDLELRLRDSDEIAPDVWEAVQEAYNAKQQLQFDYISSRYEDGLPRQNIVEPWGFYFDTARGHYYLRGYCLWRDGPNGITEPRAYRNYRLGRIQAGSAQVLPTKLPPLPRASRRYDVVYELSPEIARLGVSRQPGLVGEQQAEPAEAGWTRVIGQAEDLFLLSRNLLYYGANCRVLGGPELLREIQQLVSGLAEVYGVKGKK
jgi:predicted DNA-binding transcriptional regulator YafY